MTRIARWEGLAIAALTVAHLGMIAFYAPRLPAQVASHFGPSGAPDAWNSRDAFLIGSAVLPFAMLIVFMGCARLAHWLPPEWINLPNKRYWLAPERRSGTVERMERHLLRMGIATQALLLFVFEAVLRTNASGARTLDSSSWIALVVYCIVLAGLLVHMIREFRIPQA